MRKFLLIGGMFFTSTICLKSFGQAANQKNNIVTLSLGGSLPIGKFGSKDVSDSKSGIANFGGNLQLEFTHRVRKKFGLTVLLYGQLNPVKNVALENYFNDHPLYYYYISANAVPPNLITYQRTGWIFSTSDWQNYGILVGGSWYLPLTAKKDWLLSFKTLIGGNLSYSPKFEGRGQGSNPYDFSVWSLSKGKGLGISYLLSSGIMYNLDKHLDLIFNLQFFGTSNIKYKDVTHSKKSIINSGGNFTITSYTSEVENAIQTISQLNFNLGVAIKF